MHSMNRFERWSSWGAALVALTLCGARAEAQEPAAKVGRLGPLIPMHKDAIHASVSLANPDAPKLCFWMRPSEYRGTDMVDPNVGPTGALRPEFEQLVFGSFRFSQTLDASVRSRIKADISLENTLCMDLTHPDAFANTGKYRIEELTAEDFAMNAAAFRDAGHSKGLNYNLFCAGHSSLADGRILVAGGHDKAGNHGIRKINIFDPRTETWLPRPMPQVLVDYLADPTGTLFPHASPLDEANTDPPHASDMKYQRWYPTVVTLPDNTALILSGTDQDSSVGPRDAALTKVRMETPEVYNPVTDRTVALESARKLLPMYPRSFVVQTGPGKDDWKVAVIAEAKPPFPTGDELRGYDPWTYNGNTYLLDVRGALADPARDTPATRHWKFVDKAQAAHESGAAVKLVELNGRGFPKSQRIAVFGGDDGEGNTVATVEMIDFSQRDPSWKRQQDLVMPATQNNAVVLPNGKVLVVGGRQGGRGTLVNSFDYQLFDPNSGHLRGLVATNVPRWDHSTALLLPDATVFVMGGNRVDLLPETPDLAVPVGQLYYPPYLFQGPRPTILQSPASVTYGQRFTLEASGDIGSVVLLRTGPITHNWSRGNAYVKLTFTATRGKLEVSAPAVPGAAVPGEYMLFVLSRDGVPSVARRLMLQQ